MLEKFQKLIKEIKEENNRQEELERIKQLFNMEDYAKELLLSSNTKRQEECARSFLERINTELKMLYIPTTNKNV